MASPSSPRRSTPGEARTCRTFQHIDRLKRKLSLVAPGDAHSQRSDPELCALGLEACAPRAPPARESDAHGDADGPDEFEFEAQAEPEHEPQAEAGDDDEFAFVPSDPDDELAPPAWHPRPPARGGERAPHPHRAGASPARSPLGSAAHSSLGASRSASVDAAGSQARTEPARGRPPAGSSPVGCQSGPCTSSRNTPSASPSPHRAHAPSALARRRSPLSPARARASPSSGRASLSGAPADSALPPATMQLLAVLAHCVSTAVCHADEAEVSSEEEDDDQQRADAEHSRRARRGGCGAREAGGEEQHASSSHSPHAAERARARARVRTARCELGDVHPQVRAALLGGSPGCAMAAVELLLEQGADVDAVDADRNFPLYLACHLPAEPDALGVARTLLLRRALPNERRRGLTPLNYALRRRHAPLAQLLLQHGGYPLRWTDEPPVRPARRGAGHAPAAAPARLACPLLRAFAKTAGFWPQAASAMLRQLDEAVEQGAVPVVEGLLVHGCPPNEPDAHGRTPLFRAVAAQQRAQLVLALLRGGAHAETRDGCGTHVLAAPILRNDALTVRALLKYRADPLADEGGVRIDLFAGRYSSSGAVQALLTRCAAHALSLTGATQPEGAAGARAARGSASSTPPRARSGSTGSLAHASQRSPTPSAELPPLPAPEDEDPSIFDFA